MDVLWCPFSVVVTLSKKLVSNIGWYLLDSYVGNPRFVVSVPLVFHPFSHSAPFFNKLLCDVADSWLYPEKKSEWANKWV